MSLDFSAFGFVDVLFLAILAISVIPAIHRGFTLELVRLVGWPLSFVIAGQLTPLITQFAPEDIPTDGFAQTVLWVILFVAAMYLWLNSSRRFAPAIYQGGFGGFDRWVGFLYGVLRGIAIAMAIYGVAAYYAEGDDNLPESVTDAAFAPVVQIGLHLVADFLPEDFSDEIYYNVHRPRATRDIQKGLENSGPGRGAESDLLDLEADDYGY